MRKHSHTFLSGYLCFFSLGLVVSMAAPSLAAAGHHAASKGVTSAQAVTKRVATTSRQQLDPDRDGLTSRTEEHKTRTNPRKFDTDGDGFGDGAEILARTNPRSASSTPVGPPALPPVIPPLPPGSTPPQTSTSPPAPADTTAPATTISSGPSGTTTSTGASFAFTASESGSSFQCSLDSGSWGSCTSPKAYSGLAVGSHTFAVKATDTAGNADTSPATRSWTVSSSTPPTDTTAPETTISSGPPATTTSTSASFAFTANESGSTFQCKLDSGAWGSCTSAKSYSGLAAGSHAFSVKATDAAGNTDATPATDSWTVQSGESGGGGGKLHPNPLLWRQPLQRDHLCLRWSGDLPRQRLLQRQRDQSQQDRHGHGQASFRRLPHPGLLDAEPGHQPALRGPALHRWYRGARAIEPAAVHRQ